MLKRFNGRRGAKPFLIIQRKVGDLTGFQTDAPEKWAGTINQAIGTVVNLADGLQAASYELQAG